MATAMIRACSTPMVITPTKVTAAMTTWLRPALARLRQSAGSIRPMAAATITAPRHAVGSSPTGAVRNSRTRATTMAANTPTSWVRPPI